MKTQHIVEPIKTPDAPIIKVRPCMYKRTGPVIITQAIPNPDYALKIVTDSGRSYIFDVQPYFQYEAFKPLKKISEFLQVSCGGYFIEWACGADLSADTIEAHMRDIAQNITTA